jgi:hypothetical protein
MTRTYDHIPLTNQTMHGTMRRIVELLIARFLSRAREGGKTAMDQLLHKWSGGSPPCPAYLHLRYDITLF